MAEPYKKQKGANFERYIAEYLKNKFGYDFRRTPLQEVWKRGKTGDVNAYLLPGYSIFNELHLECFHKKSPNYLPKLIKAISDAKNRKAIVIGKKTNIDLEFVMMGLSDFIELLQEIEKFRREDISNKDIES